MDISFNHTSYTQVFFTRYPQFTSFNHTSYTQVFFTRYPQFTSFNHTSYTQVFFTWDTQFTSFNHTSTHKCSLPGTPNSMARRSANSLATSTQSSMVASWTGINGHTSIEPILGCSPVDSILNMKMLKMKLYSHLWSQISRMNSHTKPSRHSSLHPEKATLQIKSTKCMSLWVSKQN